MTEMHSVLVRDTHFEGTLDNRMVLVSKSFLTSNRPDVEHEVTTDVEISVE